MNADTLLQNLDVLIEAPDGIEKLRELILRLAAKGLMIEPSLSEKEVVEFIASNDKSASKPELKSFCNSRGKFVYQIQIADATDLVQQAQSKIKTNQIKQSGAYPVVDQGQQFISGFIDGIAPITASDKAVLVFGDHTRNIKYIDFDFVVGADGVKVLRTKYLDPKFFYYMARSINLPSRGYGRHYRAFCSSYIPVFSQKEQMMTVLTIEKLMALCDQLEQQQKQRDNLRTATRKSAIDAISTATTPEELEAAWKRINNNWEVIADTPESVDHLRSLVINLGVQGQLFSPQEIGTDGYPISWKTRKFGGYCDIEGGSQPPKDYFINELKPDYVRLFQIRDLGTNPVPVFIPRTMAKSFSVVGDILIGRYGASVGKIFRAQDGAYNVALVKFVFPKDDLVADFVFWMLQSSRIQAIFSGMSRSAQAGFNKRDLAGLDIPIPEMKEQKQIVAKIDELMALCDQLESELKSRSEVAEKFARSAVNAA